MRSRRRRPDHLHLIDTAPGFDLIATNAWVAADEILAHADLILAANAEDLDAAGAHLDRACRPQTPRDRVVE